MSNDELIKAEEELLALTKAKADKLKAEMAEAQRVAQEKELEEKLRAKILADMSKNQPTGIETVPKAEKTTKGDLEKFYTKYLKRHDYKAVEYGSQDWQIGYDFTDADTGCENDVSDWTPTEVFANLIWSGFYCKGYLAGRVTVRGIDFARGKGDDVVIRVRGKRTAQGPLGACECLSCVSSSFTKYTVHLDAYGDLAEICELDLQLAGDVVKDGILEDMASGLAEQVDEEIYAQLLGAAASEVTCAATCSDTLDTCCFSASHLYDALVEAEAEMRTAGYKPDFIILSPDVAVELKRQQALSQYGIKFGISGNELNQFGNMTVIEYPCANACSAATCVAIMLDSSRAVGEGWGMKPKLEQDRNIDCDSTTVAIHMYVGIDDLDAGAIRHIMTP